MPSSSCSRPAPAGTLVHKDHTGKVLGRKKVYPNHELVIGRDRSRCQYVLNDPYTSKRHLRIYTVVYENDEPSEVDTLVYAEDLSQNGTYWNGSFIGKGNGGFLLSDEDTLRLSRRTYFVFTATPPAKVPESFDYIQETEMANFRKDYTLSDRLLGAGAFGRVFMAIEQNARYQVACKVVDLRVLMPGSQTKFGREAQPAAAEDIDNRDQVRQLKTWAIQQKRKNALERQLSKYYREVDILASVSHPNIIGIEKVYIADNTMYIMQEIVTAGDLFSYIESKNGKLREVEAAVVIRQILVALSFLHGKNIVHRDIKPDNVLMTSLAAGCRVVLTDFGAARRIENKIHRMSSIIGTHEYAAPEILGYLKSNVEPERPGYTRAVDMWAVGCVTVVLLTGGLAFCEPVTALYSEKLARECNLEFLRKSKDWRVVRQRPKEFVEKLLLLEENARLSADEALQHSWFYNEVHKDDFQDLYQRTIKHWRPRIPKSNIIEFQDSGSIRDLECSKAFLRPPGRSKGRFQPPVEPPYKPFPRQMHQKLWPPRSPTKGLSEEALLAMETSSPTSAARLRIRAESMSPSQRPRASASTEMAMVGLSRNVRAASEPPPTRNFPVTEGRAFVGMSKSFVKPAMPLVHKANPNPPERSGQTKSVDRPPTPKPPRLLSHKSVAVTGKSTTSYVNPISAATFARKLALPENTGIPVRDASSNQSTIPNILRNEANSSRPLASIRNGNEPGESPHIRTPDSKSKLKRRSSASFATPTFKKGRSSSVFDLAEDTEIETQCPGKPRRRPIFDLSDNSGENRPRLPRFPLTHRPKDAPDAVARPTSPARNLYLPR
ncbi:hypothetical protein H2200_011925 [Cladophialophora chaetospira]|uniref:CAMK protein kinase n=1 Tax=Cladophialophora chaetospira TaxID=386627 RepID=A0AA39CCZ5_9EURO|nr:hypothetical protein H2200_011925 [Cladophialophora chaetospira]